MSLSATAICTAIAGLTVSGLAEIYTFDDAPVDMTRAKLPCIAPDLDNWSNTNEVEEAGGNTFGLSTARFWVATRPLGYILYIAAAGSNRNNPYQFAKTASDIKDALIESLLELDAANVDVVGVSGGAQAIIGDLSGNNFHGCRLAVNVREKVNA